MVDFLQINNISGAGEYWVKGGGKGSGNDTPNTFFPGAIFTRNKIVGADLTNYPAGNFN